LPAQKGKFVIGAGEYQGNGFAKGPEQAPKVSIFKGGNNLNGGLEGFRKRNVRAKDTAQKEPKEVVGWKARFKTKEK